LSNNALQRFSNETSAIVCCNAYRQQGLSLHDSLIGLSENWTQERYFSYASNIRYAMVYHLWLGLQQMDNSTHRRKPISWPRHTYRFDLVQSACLGQIVAVLAICAENQSLHRAPNIIA
jgi:hypothetical protein